MSRVPRVVLSATLMSPMDVARMFMSRVPRAVLLGDVDVAETVVRLFMSRCHRDVVLGDVYAAADLSEIRERAATVQPGTSSGDQAAGDRGQRRELRVVAVGDDEVLDVLM